MGGVLISLGLGSPLSLMFASTVPVMVVVVMAVMTILLAAVVTAMVSLRRFSWTMASRPGVSLILPLQFSIVIAGTWRYFCGSEITKLAPTCSTRHTRARSTLSCAERAQSTTLRRVVQGACV